MDALAAPPLIDSASDKAASNPTFFQNVAPSWGSYLYQNVLPNIPTDWLINANVGNTTSTTTTATHADPQSNIFNAADPNSWSGAIAASAATPSSQMPVMGQAGPSNYCMNFYGGSIAPSLLAPSVSSTGSGTPSTTHISPSIDVVDKIVASPSPMNSIDGSPHSTHRMKMAAFNVHGRVHSLDSDAYGEVDPEAGDNRSQHSNDQESYNEHEHDEGVERDGMIWGMKVDEYRALSARERKRVRNRISARTFRAKRKEHLNSLESTLGAKDLEIKLLHEENMRLRREVGELKRRMAHYEQKPY